MWLLQSGVVNGFAAALKFVARFLGGAEEEIRMRLRVIADEVAVRDGFFREPGTLFDEFADQKERSFGVVFGEEVEELWSNGGIGAVVEGDR